MRIFLIGFSGSGKSTYGKMLARLYQYRFLDTDAVFCQQKQTTIPDFFKNYGEEQFRLAEHDILKQLCKIDCAIISLGGGTPCFYDNMKMMKSSGTVVYIKMAPASIFKRLSESKTKRPLIFQKNPEELQQYIEKTLQERTPFYEQADIVVKGENMKAEILKSAIDYHIEN